MKEEINGCCLFGFFEYLWPREITGKGTEYILRRHKDAKDAKGTISDINSTSRNIDKRDLKSLAGMFEAGETEESTIKGRPLLNVAVPPLKQAWHIYEMWYIGNAIFPVEIVIMDYEYTNKSGIGGISKNKREVLDFLNKIGRASCRERV